MDERSLRVHRSLEDILFPVVKVRTDELYPETIFAKRLSHAIHIPEKNKTVHFCSNNYLLVENDKLFLPMAHLLGEICENEGYHMLLRSYDDRKFYGNFAINQTWYEVEKGDLVCPMIEVKNSYDGTLRQSATLSFYRQLHATTLWGFGRDYSVAKKHKGAMATLDLKDMFQDLVQFEKRIQIVKKFAARHVTIIVFLVAVRYPAYRIKVHFRKRVFHTLKCLKHSEFVREALLILLTQEERAQPIGQQAFQQVCWLRRKRLLELPALSGREDWDAFLYPLRTDQPERIRIPDSGQMPQTLLFLFHPKDYVAVRQHLHYYSLLFWRKGFFELLWLRKMQHQLVGWV